VLEYKRQLSKKEKFPSTLAFKLNTSRLLVALYVTACKPVRYWCSLSAPLPLPRVWRRGRYSTR